MRGNEKRRIGLDSDEYTSVITYVSCIFGESQNVASNKFQCNT